MGRKGRGVKQAYSLHDTVLSVQVEIIRGNRPGPPPCPLHTLAWGTPGTAHPMEAWRNPNLTHTCKKGLQT